jgi:hypothetical protein
MDNTYKIQLFKVVRALFLVSVPICFWLMFSLPISAQDSVPYLSCKKLPDGITSERLEQNLKRLLNGEATFLYQGVFQCRDAVPVLRKYELDTDPDRRRIVTGLLQNAYKSVDRLRILALQIQTFPTASDKTMTFYAREYPCYYFKKVNFNKFGNALITRIKATNGEYNGDEIYLLGCLSRQLPKAQKYLQEMWQLDYKTKLDADERENQRENIFYALAEAGEKDAEEKVLSDISAMTETSNSEKIQSILDDAKSFTNCRIVERYVSLIKDKREISRDEYRDGEIKKLKGRIGDMAISQFTSIYGTEVIGEKDVSFSSHTDEEMERIYKRVKSFVKKKVSSSCDFGK